MSQKTLRLRLAVIVTATLLALLACFPLQEKLRFGLDLGGGIQFELELALDEAVAARGEQVSPDEAQRLRDDAANRALETITRRVDGLGLTQPLIARSGPDGERLTLQLPGMHDRERAIRIFSETSRLELRLAPERSVDPATLRHLPAPGSPENPRLAGVWFGVGEEAVISGDDLIDARASSGADGRPVVAFDLTREAGLRFDRFTRAHLGETLAVLIDGEVVTAATIDEPIATRGVIRGSYSVLEAQDLALSLRSGALPVSVSIYNESSIGPSLGADALQAGLVAAVAGLLALGAFLTAWYRWAGLQATAALLLNLLFVLAALALLDAALTLPGIAGLVLTAGMAVDANVLVLERIKEELRTGRSLSGAISTGFRRALPAVLDANITTGLAAVVLYNFGSAPLRGFAVTLCLGIVSTLVTAFPLSRTLFAAGLALKGSDWRPFGRLGSAFKLPVLRRPRLALLGAGLAVGLSVAALMGGALSPGIDFTGGTQLIVEGAGDAMELRDELDRQGFGSARVQTYGSPGEDRFLVRSQETEASEALDASADWEVVGRESLRASAGAEMRASSVRALVLAAGAVAAYVAARFELRHAVAALLALTHDVLITLAVLGLVGIDLGLEEIAALMTIVGYSLNDTVVVFDRIRENLKEQSGSLLATLQASLSQTLPRTLLTSGTTLLVLACLLLAGGPGLHDFAVTLSVGVVVGTLSSLYVAAPLLLPGRPSEASVSAT